MREQLTAKNSKIVSEIRSGIQSMEVEFSLYDKMHFIMRAEAIDFIDFHVIDRINAFRQNNVLEEELHMLRIRASKLKLELEQIDKELFHQLREEIKKSNDKVFSFKKIFSEYSKECSDSGQVEKIGYDNLDIFINGLLFCNAIPEAERSLEPDMVFYQKTPARVILELAARIQPGGGEVFFDIGSGIGEAVIFMRLMGDVESIGIEYEPSYCTYAKHTAARLDLNNIAFINADARDIDYSKGTAFFLYTPFRGRMMHDVLEILHKISLKKVIRIFSYGPCSMHMGRQNWLNCIDGKVDHVHKLYEFRSGIQGDF